MQVKTSISKALSFLILLSSLLAVAVSCKKDKDVIRDTPAPTEPTRISEYKNGEEFVHFDYNQDGTVRKATVKDELSTNGEVIEYNISYDVAKKITAIESSAGEKIIPVYENGALTRTDIFVENERTGFNNYHFENNQLKRITLYWGEGTDFMPIFELNFAYDNAGNNTETVLLASWGEPGNMQRIGHLTYEYDTKVNPLHAQKELLALLLQGASKNNVIKEDQFDSDLQLEERTTYTYTYKTNGLPAQAEVKKGLPGQAPAVSELKFTYK